MTSFWPALAVTRITGMKGRLVSALIRRTTSSPSILGIMMSSSTRSGSVVVHLGQRLLAVLGHDHLVTQRAQSHA